MGAVLPVSDLIYELFTLYATVFVFMIAFKYKKVPGTKTVMHIPRRSYSINAAA